MPRSDSGDSWERRGDVAGPADVLQEHPPRPEESRPALRDGRAWRRSPTTAGAPSAPVGERSKHVDNHYYWIDPDDTDHILAGCDGGLYESWDRGRIWRHFTNLSVTQFYNVDVDNASPIYNVYGGTQDNSTLGGPSRVARPPGRDQQRLVHRDRRRRLRGAHRPDRPEHRLRASRSTAASSAWTAAPASASRIRPVEGKGEPPLRFNWESPFIISPHSPVAALFRRRTGCSAATTAAAPGAPVSPDLTRQIDRNLLPVMGRIWPPEAIAKHQSTSTYGNITAAQRIAEKGGPDLRRHRRRPGPGDRGRRQDWRKSREVPGAARTTARTASTFSGSSPPSTTRTPSTRSSTTTRTATSSPTSTKSTDKGATWVFDRRRPAGQRPGALASPKTTSIPTCSSAAPSSACISPSTAARSGSASAATCRRSRCATWRSRNARTTWCWPRSAAASMSSTTTRRCGRSSRTSSRRTPTSSPIEARVIEVTDTGKTRGSQGEQFWMGENARRARSSPTG